MTENDLVGVGGSLAPAMLIGAYAAGKFPMYIRAESADGNQREAADESAEPQPRREVLGWFQPDPRGVLFPSELKVSDSLRRQLRKFHFSVDVDFERVMRECGDKRREHGWINEDFVAAYTQLHQMGFAHSIEVWNDDTLVGGLYGVSIGGLFAGESMFHLPNSRGRDASKAALVALVTLMEMSDDRESQLIDAQWETPHLKSLGVRSISAPDYDTVRDRAMNVESAFELAPQRFNLNS